MVCGVICIRSFRAHNDSTTHIVSLRDMNSIILYDSHAKQYLCG